MGSAPSSTKPDICSRLAQAHQQLKAVQSAERKDEPASQGLSGRRHSAPSPRFRLTSLCQMGLVVLLMMVDLLSCPWWAHVGKLLFFPG